MPAKARTRDKELGAIRKVHAALKPLDDTERERVIAYVMRRLDPTPVRIPRDTPARIRDAEEEA